MKGSLDEELPKVHVVAKCDVAGIKFIWGCVETHYASIQYIYIYNYIYNLIVSTNMYRDIFWG